MGPACLSPSLGLGAWKLLGALSPTGEASQRKKKEAEINSRKKVNDHVAPDPVTPDAGSPGRSQMRG